MESRIGRDGCRSFFAALAFALLAGGATPARAGVPAPRGAGAARAARVARGAGASRFTFLSERVDVRRVFQMIARAGRLNLVFHRDVRGEVAVRLADATIDEALRHVARRKGLKIHPVAGLEGTFVILPEGRTFPPLRFGVGRGAFRGFTLKAEDVDVSRVVQMIARAGRLRVVLSPRFRGKMPVELTNVPYRAALELLAGVCGFEVVEAPGLPGIYVIRPLAPGGDALVFAPAIDGKTPADFALRAEGIPAALLLRQIALHAGIDIEVQPGLTEAVSLEIEGVRPLEALRLACLALGVSVEAVAGKAKTFRVR